MLHVRANILCFENMYNIYPHIQVLEITCSQSKHVYLTQI